MRYIPFHVLFMIVLTGLYLSVEVPFAAYLLHFFGGQSSTADIHKVEEFGRVLTGIAVFIAVLGWMVPRFVVSRASIKQVLFTSILTGAITIFGTFHLLNLYGTLSAEFASEDELRSAYVGMLARRVVAENGVGDLHPAANNAAWHAFVATAASTSDIPNLLKATGSSVKQLVADETVRTVGISPEMRERFFGTSFDKVRRSYNDYADGSNAYSSAIRNVEKDGSHEWDKYISDLRARYPEGIPRRGWTTAGIRNKVKEKLPVSSEWDIVDRNGFMVAYRQVAVKEIKLAYADKITSLLGSDAFLEPGLSFDAFLADNDVQKVVRSNLKRDLDIDIGNAVVNPGMSTASFDTAIYRPYLTKVANDLADVAINKDGRLSGGQLDMAKKAYQAATLPATALLLSLAGAALHVFKFASYLAQAYGFMRGSLRLSHGRFKFATGTAVLLCGVTTMLILGDSITTTKTYRSITTDGIYSTVVRNAVSIQPSFQTFSTALATTGLWSVVSASLPQPKPFIATISNETTASTVTDADQAEVETGSTIIPTPTPRPKA
jgi:hypothetical protein